ncbi:hypothetical protein ACFQDE_10555 [Deinococcus caeni]|uniref:hypothetical protein n=1 Tax=Deinococcus caeni TaxID=569127 RepID=UPI003606CE07
MQHTRTWSDVYGSALALFEGRAGGTRGWSRLPRPWRVGWPGNWWAWTARAA